MKMITHALILLFLVQMGWAQQDKKVEAEITHVTVFLNNAQVTRDLKTRIEPGKTNLIVSGLTAQLDPNSIQVSGKGNFVLLGISHQQNFLSEFSRSGKIKILNDSVNHLQSEIGFENTQKEILNKEEQMLLSNQKIGGANQNLPVAELKSMADFFRARLYDIALSRIRHDQKIVRLNERMSRISQQQQTENELSARNTSEIIITVSAEKSTEAEFVLNYIVANAGWNALYDLRAANTKAPISLFYKANVFQRTGENWKNVRLKLSTANPTLGGAKPELLPWYLDFFQPSYYRKKDKSAMPVDGRAPGLALSEVVVEEAETTADFVSVIQTSLNTEFDIDLSYTVNSANKPTTVDIGHHELKSDYKYSVTPKMDADAFLMAEATGWEAFDLLPGEANVFFEGTFVGKTYLDPQSTKDTLYISLGRDKRIVVKREKVKDFNSRTIIGMNQKENYAYEINVRNNKSENVTLTVEDQIPVSKNSQIEVTMVEAEGAKYDPARGKLVWQITLNPNESKKLAYHFQVRYPKDKLIAGLN